MNLFFDVTPISSIMSRFSVDIGVIDKEIFTDLQAILTIIFMISGSLTVAVVATPLILPIVFIVFTGIFLVFKSAH